MPSQERGWIVTPERMVRRRCAGGRVDGWGRLRTAICGVRFGYYLVVG